MRRMITLAVVLVALVPTAAAGERDLTGKPALTLARAAPLTLRGTHFQPAERVRIAVSGVRTKRVTADGAGTFSVGYPSVTYDRCNGLIARAVGSEGSRATLKRPELQCPLPL
jgi:hypothetical protein